MYFELQLSAVVFTRAVRNRLKALPLFVDLSFPDVDGTPLVVDEVIIGDETTLQRERVLDAAGVPMAAATQTVWTFSPNNLTSFTVPYLQVRQEVRVLLVRESDLDANGPLRSAPHHTFTLFPVFNVALTPTQQTQGGGPLTLSYTLAYVDFGLVGQLLPAAQKAQIVQVIAGVQVASSTVDLGALTALMDRQIAAVNAGIACDPAGSRVALRADFDVYASPIAIGPAFFEAGPDDLLAGNDWAMLLDADVLIQEAERRTKRGLDGRVNVRVLAGPKAQWDASETTLRIGTDVRLLGACPGFVDDIDIDARVELAGRFTVPLVTPDNLITHYHLTSAKINAAQLIGCALTGTVLFPFIGTALFAIDTEFSLSDYLGGVVFGPYLAFGNLLGYINAKKLSDDISQSLRGTCHKVDDENYECTTAVELVMQLAPGLNSRLRVNRAHGVPAGLVLSGAVDNLPEAYPGEIGDITVRPFQWKVLGRCTGNSRNNFAIGNEARVFVPYTPPPRIGIVRILGNTPGYALRVDDNDITVTPSSPPASSPCRIRLVTNRGVRTLTLTPAQALGEDEAAQLKADLLDRAMQCYYKERQFMQVEKVRWLVDPPQRQLVDPVQYWQVLVKGAGPGDKLVVRDPTGSTVLTARPADSGSIHVSIMFAAAAAPDELTLELERPHDEAARSLEVSTQQTLYDLRATLPIAGDLQWLDMGGTLRAPQLAIGAAGRSQRWDISTPGTPVLLESTAGDQPADALVVHTGQRVGTAPLTHLSRAVEAISEQTRPPHAVASPVVLGFSNTLAVRTGRGTTVFDVSEPHRPMEIQVFATPAWFEGTVIGVDRMARSDPKRELVELYGVAGRYTP
jgi:hypothetical protein